MAKSVFIAEKPSVAREFAKALKEEMRRGNGYLESQHYIVTWCVGHLVTMSYPEVYDPKMKKWSLSTLPFLPQDFLYELIPSASNQFRIVEGLLNREDVSTIYICTDSGREGEYIYRLVDQEAKVPADKKRKRVWIDSQTEEEIIRGIKEAKDWSAYDSLSDAAYLRAKEDYLMGINFSRLLTLKYGNSMANFLGMKYSVVSVGRVMTCVLGMVVKREREIREFTKTPFYRIFNEMEMGGNVIKGEWKVTSTSNYFQSPGLYKENGFLKRETAQECIEIIKDVDPYEAIVTKVGKKKETKRPPLLYNLAELQNDCSKLFKISPDQTLQVIQELYEKKMVTYPRTDARVLSTSVAKEIDRNLLGLKGLNQIAPYIDRIMESGTYKSIAKTRYVDDKQVTDHFAVIPTGQGINSLKTLNALSAKVYETIVRRFIAIFFPPAIYRKIMLEVQVGSEHFFSNFKVLEEEGYLAVMNYSFAKKKNVNTSNKDNENNDEKDNDEDEEQAGEGDIMALLAALKKGAKLPINEVYIKEGETSPPKRYNSGSLILAMENAGQLIEDEELRAQIKGCGVGTSATRADILKKLVGNKYLALNKKTQVVTPQIQGEMIYDIASASIKSLLNPKLTASWEKGLNYVADGTITKEEYMTKLEDFVVKHTQYVLGLNNQYALKQQYQAISQFYKLDRSSTNTNKRKYSAKKSSTKNVSEKNKAK